MQGSKGSFLDDDGSARRVTVYALVIVIHAGLLLGLLQMSARPWLRLRRINATPSDALYIRLLLRSAPQPVRRPLRVPPITLPVRQRAPARTARMTATTRASSSPPPAQVSPQPAVPSPTNEATAPAAGDYVAGGTLFNGVGEPRESTVRLPGSAQPIVGHLHMVDPTAQGIGGLAHGLQHLFGVPDKHCYAVDAWRGMSMRELLAHHLTPARVAQVAATYHCGVARASHSDNLAEPLSNVYDELPQH